MKHVHNGSREYNKFLRVVTLFVILLFVNIPFIFALQISSVSTTSISDSSATITWQTDEDASSVVEFGLEEDALVSVSDSELTSMHSVQLNGLQSGEEYVYQVKSSVGEESVVDTNDGALYTFTTLVEAPEDTSDEISDDTLVAVGAPSLEIEHPEIIAGNEITVTGEASGSSQVRLFVNGGYFGVRTISGSYQTTGPFSFVNAPLMANSINTLTLEATGSNGESTTFEGQVFSDTIRPTLDIDSFSAYVDEQSTQLSGTVSEDATIEIYKVGNESERSLFSTQGISFDADITLEEGMNTIEVRATDEAGWVISRELTIISDTQDPEISAEFVKGESYFQNRAQSPLTGSTEPGAILSLYVYRPLGYEYTPDFSSPRAVVIADMEGNFTFDSVNFERDPLAIDLPEIQDYSVDLDVRVPEEQEYLEYVEQAINTYSPPEVPSGLSATTVYPIDSIAQAQEFTYHVYLIAEDRSGKTGYWDKTITIQSCFSPNLDFIINDNPQFQRPLRLDPNLLDEGREVATAVFDLEYNGAGAVQIDPATGRETRKAVQINSVTFDKACTQEMINSDDRLSIGCKILPPRPQVLPNPTKDSYYLTWDLLSSEDMSSRNENLWEDFQDRNLVFPLKINVNYQEFDSLGNLGDSKTQTSCFDLGYFVDIPLESSELIPDWLANDGISVLNKTISVLDDILPVLEKVILVTGISCFVSIGIKTVIRFARIFTAKLEYIQDKLPTSDKEDGEECPANSEQNEDLFLEDTLENWMNLLDHPDLENGAITSEYNNFPSNVKTVLEELHGNFDPENEEIKKISMDARCPQTAALWKAETGLDQVYRWTCDRFLCRAVPARWTQDKTEIQVDTVKASQQQCSVTSTGVPLEEIENCQEFLKQNPTVQVQNVELNTIATTCYRHDGDLYYVSEEESRVDDEEKAKRAEGVFTLTLAGSLIGNMRDSKPNLIAYKPSAQTDQFIVAKDQSCKSLCRSKAGYIPVDDGYIAVAGQRVVSGGGACYREITDGNGKFTLSGTSEAELGVKNSKFQAGYTNDCFVDDEGDRYQCVCKQPEDKGRKNVARTALRVAESEIGSTQGREVEKFSYRQERINRESNGAYGTFYPKWRYYNLRDASSAFGANYVLDIFNIQNPKVAEINPATQFLGAWQTVCLSKIRAQLVMLRSILAGLQGCIEQAKYTGFQDAGMCKTLFTQHVCGLVYKIISFAGSSCSPAGFNDVGKGNDVDEGGLGALISAGTSSIQESMQSSIDDLKSDYGNAHLTEYFAGGAQGFTESICAVAFGADWPIGADFIMDTAYSSSIKTTPQVFPATREFVSYNVQQSTAVYNYDVGEVIFPGCRIRNYQTYLKCISPEEMSKPGVQCGDAGCDCVNNYGQSAFENEKKHVLDGGSGSSLPQGSMFDVPIPSPQRVDKHFRYDHVVVEMQLDPNEDIENCFDEGFRNGENGGIFYFPITDLSPPGTVDCQLQAASGQFSCPEVSSLFYTEGLAYLEDPYVTCFDKNTGQYSSCQTPNMFTLDDEIKIKPLIYTDGEGYCLDVKVNGAGLDTSALYSNQNQYGPSGPSTSGMHLTSQPMQIPTGITGQLRPSITIGTVSEDMFGGSQNGLSLARTKPNNIGCPLHRSAQNSGATPSTGNTYTFDYTALSGGLFELNIYGRTHNGGILPHLAVVQPAGFQVDTHGKLIGPSGSALQLSQINGVTFSVEGMHISGVLGDTSGARQVTSDGVTECVYDTQAAGASVRQVGGGVQERIITVTTTLLHPDALGSCYAATVPVNSGTALGLSSATTRIRVQREHQALQGTSQMLTLFQEGYYGEVKQLATGMMNQFAGYTQDAIGTFYYVATFVAEDGINWRNTQRSNIVPLLNRFFLRVDHVGNSVAQFTPDVRNTGEFQKSRAYLCFIADELGVAGNYETSQDKCSQIGIGS